MGKLNDLVKGFGMPFAAFTTIRKPGLFRFAAIPLAINILLFIGGFALLWLYRVDLIELLWKFPEDSTFMSILWYGLAVIVFALATVLAYFLFTPIGCLIASPFNDFLSAKAEFHFDPENAEEDVRFSFGELLKILRKEGAKLLVMGVILLVGALLNLLPGLGTVLSLVFGGIVGSWYLSLQYIDYPMARHGYTFREQTTVVRKQLWLALGFGAAAMLLLLIPLLNLVCIPVCVVAATELFTVLRKDRDLPKPAKVGRG